MLRRFLFAMTIATPALADVPEAVQNTILPGYDRFVVATQALSDAAAQDCAPEALRPAFNAAFDAWVAVQYLQFGPVEDDGKRLAIEYWPDPKGMGAKAQRRILLGDPSQLEPAAFAEQSVAARGLAALERLLYPAEAPPADTCPLIRATTLDLARMAAEVQAAWTGGYADTLLTAGQPGNTTFLTPSEARQILFTQVAAGLEFLTDTRIGRPLGTFDQPHPERAESRASERSLINIRLSLEALKGMVQSLTTDAPLTIAALDRAIGLANKLNDPVLAGVSEPQGWLKVQILQQSITAVREAALAELAPKLGVGVGFNAADGD